MISAIQPIGAEVTRMTGVDAVTQSGGWMPSLPELGGSAQAAAHGGEVSSFFSELVAKVNQMQSSADGMVKKFAAGEGGELHEVMLAVEKAGISFQYLNQVRNKAIEAYQEIMKMPV